MKLNIKLMNFDEARQISKWIYKEPYSLYSMNESDNCIEELLSGNYFSASDIENNLVGYFCFGESAQVPVGNQYGVYNNKTPIDIGLGMKPNLCGHGLGEKFLRNGLDYAKVTLHKKQFRLTVASFNQRAINVYQRIGFKKHYSFERLSEHMNTEFWVMIYDY